MLLLRNLYCFSHALCPASTTHSVLLLLHTLYCWTTELWPPECRCAGNSCECGCGGNRALLLGRPGRPEALAVAGRDGRVSVLCVCPGVLIFC